MATTKRGPARVRSELFRVFRKLRPEDLALEADASIPPDVGLKDTEHRVHLMFGVYSADGLRRALEAYGTFDRLAERGVGEVDFRLKLDDPFRPNVQLWSRTFDQPIVDIVYAQTDGEAVGLPPRFAKAKLLSLESVLLQNPGKGFDWSRPPLPEQRFPGLSLSGDVLDLVVLTARRINADGLVLTPSTFHAARIYERHFQFVDGAAEGNFRALRHAGELRPLWLLSWAISLGCVKEDGRIFVWRPSPMFAPLHEPLAAVFEGREYKDAVARNEQRTLEIDFDLLRERFPWTLMPKARPPAIIKALLKPPG